MNSRKKIIVGGSDVVGIDIVIPKIEFLTEKLKNYPENLKTALEIFDKLEEIICADKKPGDKYSGTEQDREKLNPLLKEFQKAIEPSGIETVFVGTTIANKLHYLKCIADNQVEAVLFSAVSDDTHGKTIKKTLARNEITLKDLGEETTNTRVNFCMFPKGSSNRIINKLPFEAPEYFYDLDKQISNAKSCDIYLLEASQIQYFKNSDDFIEFLHAVKESGTKLVFAYPTDRKFFIDKEKLTDGYRRNALKTDYIKGFKAAHELSNLITCNETEAIWASGKPFYKEKVTDENDNHLRMALRKMKRNIGAADMLVTAGEHGLFIFNSHYSHYHKVGKVEIVNNAGAGDCAAAMAVYGLLVAEQNSYRLVNTAELIEKACNIKLQSAQTQVPQAIFRIGMNGKIPSFGEVEDISPPNKEIQKGK
jgi:sugar/nucleoside kinase (ribokinase family)